MGPTIDEPAALGGTFLLGGDVAVHRLGFGAMQITGPGVWGEPQDAPGAVAVLRRAVDLGIDLIDTADAYGPEVSERLIAEALRPYPRQLVIATKAGLERPGPNQWTSNGRPAHLRVACEGSLRRLRVERIDLFQLHRIDPDVPLEEQIGALSRLQEEGKIRHIGLSEVSVAEIRAARRLAAIVSVQNRYNLTQRHHEPVLEYCESEGIAFLPWFPLATGALARSEGGLARLAERLGATPAQVALAWLLRRSTVMLPIPGTSRVSHLDENVGAARLRLGEPEYQELVDMA